MDRKVKDYDYLVSMAILKLSMEEKDKLLKTSEAKKEELRILQSKTWSDLWEADLDTFMEALTKQVCYCYLQFFRRAMMTFPLGHLLIEDDEN